MKNIKQILAEIGVTIPAEKEAEFNKLVSENYKTISEHEKVTGKLQIAEETLKKFEGIDVEQMKNDVAGWQKKYQEAEAGYKKQIAERDYTDALKTAFDGIKFTSNAAKEAIMAKVKGKNLSLDGGKIIGLNDTLELLKSEDPTAFVDVKQEDADKKKAHFTVPQGGTPNSGGGTRKKFAELSLDERIKLKNEDPELYKAMRAEK